jgi:hypothetical protein
VILLRFTATGARRNPLAVCNYGCIMKFFRGKLSKCISQIPY